MAVFSMTGFASVHGTQMPVSCEPATSTQKVTNGLGIELRSVNSRFLDLSFRVPDDLRATEPLLREHLQKAFKRGKIEVRLWYEAIAGPSTSQWDIGSAPALIALQESILQYFPNALPLRSIDLLRLADRPPDQPRPGADQMLALIDQGILALTAARAKEGQRLATMLLGHCAQLRGLANSAEPLAKTAVGQHQTRFLLRWQEALALGESITGEAPNAQAKTERALAEATAYALRIDIAEEVTRLHSHLQEIESLLQTGGELGKRLDFLIQELHREANTLGSKSQSIDLTRVSVDMKVLIEQMREQVQNIE